MNKNVKCNNGTFVGKEMWANFLGVTTACNRNRIDIKVLEKDLVGLWWDEYEYAGVSFYLRLPKGASQLRVRPALAF